MIKNSPYVLLHSLLQSQSFVIYRTVSLPLLSCHCIFDYKIKIHCFMLALTEKAIINVQIQHVSQHWGTRKGMKISLSTWVSYLHYCQSKLEPLNTCTVI